MLRLCVIFVITLPAEEGEDFLGDNQKQEGVAEANEGQASIEQADIIPNAGWPRSGFPHRLRRSRRLMAAVNQLDRTLRLPNRP